MAKKVMSMPKKLRSDSEEEYAARKARFRATAKKAKKVERRKNIIRTAKDVGKEAAIDVGVGLATGGIGTVGRAIGTGALKAAKALRAMRAAKALKRGRKAKAASKAKPPTRTNTGASIGKQPGDPGFRYRGGHKMTKAERLKSTQQGMKKKFEAAVKKVKERVRAPEFIRNPSTRIRKGATPLTRGVQAAGITQLAQNVLARKKSKEANEKKKFEFVTTMPTSKSSMTKYKPITVKKLVKRKKKETVLTAKERGRLAVSGLKKGPTKSRAERKRTLEATKKRRMSY